jgi:hypothetical protein
MSGFITSAVIIAVCGAGLHTLVNMRREQAKLHGVPYMDRGRLVFVAVVGGLGAIYFGWLALLVARG